MIRLTCNPVGQYMLTGLPRNADTRTQMSTLGWRHVRRSDGIPSAYWTTYQDIAENAARVLDIEIVVHSTWR